MRRTKISVGQTHSTDRSRRKRGVQAVYPLGPARAFNSTRADPLQPLLRRACVRRNVQFPAVLDSHLKLEHVCFQPHHTHKHTHTHTHTHTRASTHTHAHTHTHHSRRSKYWPPPLSSWRCGSQYITRTPPQGRRPGTVYTSRPDTRCSSS